MLASGLDLGNERTKFKVAQVVTREGPKAKTLGGLCLLALFAL